MQLAWKYFILAIVCFIAGILVSIGFRSCKPSEPIEPVIIHDTFQSFAAILVRPSFVHEYF